jgi:uncharacterized protein (TIGR03083 family)
MTAQTLRNVEQIRPITFATDAREVALGVHAKLVRFLEQLEPDDWSAPTDCPAWDVADMVGHIIGEGRANASLRELLRQQIWAMRHKGEFGGSDLDAMNALQVRDHAGLTPAQRVAALHAITTAAVKGRMRFPRLLRSVRLPVSANGSSAVGMPTSLTLGHLMAVIYTRDAWLHRVDIARATGRTLDLDHIDARVIEDVAAEWARRHGQPFHLTLTGPAGGEFRQGDGGTRIELDAVEFCRALSGRAPADGLLATRVLF